MMVEEQKHECEEHDLKEIFNAVTKDVENEITEHDAAFLASSRHWVEAQRATGETDTKQ